MKRRKAETCPINFNSVAVKFGSILDRAKMFESGSSSGHVPKPTGNAVFVLAEILSQKAMAGITANSRQASHCFSTLSPAHPPEKANPTIPTISENPKFPRPKPNPLSNPALTPPSPISRPNRSSPTNRRPSSRWTICSAISIANSKQPKYTHIFRKKLK